MSTEADRLVAAAAAKGELPIINQGNRQAFGLTCNRRRVGGQGWRAWWVMGTSGITHHTTRFCIATTDLAHDGEPWPNMWSLDLWRQIAASGHEDVQLAFARRFDAESPQFGFTQITPVVGAYKPITVRCNCCGAQREHAKVRGLINPQRNPNRCFAQDNKGKSGDTLVLKAGAAFNDKLAARGINRRINPADYVNDRTPIWCSCDCPEGGHMQLPKHILIGYRTCRSSRRQKMANGKISAGQLGQMGGVASIPFSLGTAADAPWRVLTDKQKQSNRPTEIYLWQTAVASVRNFGIAYDTAIRSKKHHPDNVVALLDTRDYPDRDTAVLIEGAIKHLHACPVPPGLGGCGNTTEYTLLGDAEFWAEISRLEEELAELGPVEFVRQYCHPWQIQAAENEGIKLELLAQQFV